MLITKRNGELQEFDGEKIKIAISKANQSVAKKHQMTEWQVGQCAEDVIRACSSKDQISVEEVQDLVERNIMYLGFYEIAKNYITYRYLHQLARDKYKDLMDRIAEKITAKNVVNQNANVDEFSFGGRTGEAASVITREYALKYLMSDKAKTAHEDNTIYTHDLDSYSIGDHNCLTVPIDYLLKHGFTTRQTDVRPARSLNTAFQLIAVLFQLQSLQQFGGVSAGHLCTSMVPYVRISFFKHFRDGMHYLNNITDELFESYCKHNNISETTPIDAKEYQFYKNAYSYAMDMTKKECRQGVEGLMHNLDVWVA